MLSAIDKIFRKYGVEEFGEEEMSKLTDGQIEDARCKAFETLGILTSKFGKQEKGVVENLFCEYVKEKLRNGN